MNDPKLEHIQGFLDKLEERMDKRWDRIDSKIDKLAEISTANAIKLAENTNSLVEHMRRTELLEEEVKNSKMQLAKHQDSDEMFQANIEKEQKDLRDSVEFMVKFPKFIYIFGKWLTMASAVVGFIYAVAKLFPKIW